MLKAILLLLTPFCFINHFQAQNSLPTENALNTSGSSGTAGSLIVTYSVGETVAFANSCSYTPGVIQPGCLCIVPVNEVFDQQFSSRFYPNPASSHVIIETDFPGFVAYSLHSAQGKLIEAGKFDYTPIEMGKLVAGTYILRLTAADEQIFKSVKIIKQ